MKMRFLQREVARDESTHIVPTLWRAFGMSTDANPIQVLFDLNQELAIVELGGKTWLHAAEDRN
jgi:hypothetical protein